MIQNSFTRGLIYTHHILYFYLKGLKDLFIQHTSHYVPLPKIVIVDRHCFILMILHGSYTYFLGPIEGFFLHWSIDKIFLRNSISKQFVV